MRLTDSSVCMRTPASPKKSVNDGLAYPAQHIDFVLKNGMDAWALTDHGNGSGLAHAQAHAKKMKKAGQKYRQLNGVEFYFVPSLKRWATQYQDHKDAVTAARSEKKSKESTDIDADDEVEGGHTIENEDETKDVSTLDVKNDEWKRRYHLVVIAKNKQGLSNLFTLVKKSFQEGYYRFPRIDFDMLKAHGEGLVVSTACVGGIFSNRVLRGQALHKSDAEIQDELKNLADRFVDAVGLENFNLELQFNKLQMQHDVNRHLIQLHKSTNIPLVATCDSHYPTPDKWKTRELYKKLAWMGPKDEVKPLPLFEELKCELYPKNATQMWEEYQRHLPEHEFYQGTEEIVRDAIERTHDIAWQQCEDVWVDTKAKLPIFDTPERTGFQQLVDLVKEKMIEMSLHEKPEYMARVKEELADIKYLGHASYFLTMNKIFHKAAERTLFGPGRGSAPGSLINYILGITQIDPLPYNLLWSRFLGRHRCIQGDTLVITEEGTKPIKALHVGDKVLTSSGKHERVIDKEDDTNHTIKATIKTSRQDFVCSTNHRWLVRRNDEIIEVLTTDIVKGDKLLFLRNEDKKTHI